MTPDEVITELGRLLAGLAVPISLPTPLGTAREPWRRLHGELIGFGWATADEYEAALRERITIKEVEVG